MSETQRPDIVLYTAATMNGWKPLIFLEEAGVDYDLVHIDFGAKQQKDPEYVRLNPNGRIPTIVDRGRGEHVVFESGAILWYLAERFGRFLPEDPLDRSRVLQWIMFQVSGVGPMMGQAMFFQRIASPRGHHVPYAIERYVRESRRLLEVLDAQLAENEWVAGAEYTIADMAMYPWARAYFWAGVDVEGLEHLGRWFEVLDGREAVQRALEIPRAVPEFFGRGDVGAELEANAGRFKDDAT